MIRFSAILPHVISYTIVAIAFFVLGIWYHSGTTPVIPNPVVKYVPHLGNYLDLPDFNPPVYSYIVVKKETIKTRVDTFRVPVEINKVKILSNEGVRINNKAVFVRYYDSAENQYRIDQYKIPERKIWHSIQVVAMTQPLNESLPVYGGLRAMIGYKQIGFSGTALLTPNGSTLILSGLTLNLY